MEIHPYPEVEVEGFDDHVRAGGLPQVALRLQHSARLPTQPHLITGITSTSISTAVQWQPDWRRQALAAARTCTLARPSRHRSSSSAG